MKANKYYKNIQKQKLNSSHRYNTVHNKEREMKSKNWKYDERYQITSNLLCYKNFWDILVIMLHKFM